MSNTRAQLLQSLADIVADYRQDDTPPRSPELINAWLLQFPDAIQEQILASLVHVFKKTYISKDGFKEFLAGLASTDKLSPGASPADYWKSVNLLDIQQGGSSQKDLLATFDDVLQEAHGFGVDDTGSDNGHFVYLDDCIGTGSRVRADVCAWLVTDTPMHIVLHIITPVLYRGSYWIDQKIQDTATSIGKTLVLHKWRLNDFDMENRLRWADKSDVLWPTELPDEPSVKSYARQLESNGHPVALRNPGNSGASGIFKDDDQKVLLEQAFLLRGCQIRQEYSNLPYKCRPLGYHNLDSLGFGSMFVTYRNCPNNCPLVLWVEQANFPALFPRKTNTQTADEDFLNEFLI